MPMEVFTISGAAGLGYDALDHVRQLDRERAAKARGTATASSSSSGGGSPAVALQNALVALGNARGDGTLNIAIDGAIGPGTVKALNYALKTYVGTGPLQHAGLGGRFLNATATKTDVMQYVGTLVQVVTQAVQAAGGSVPPPPAVTGRSRSSRTTALDTPAASDPATSSGHPAMPWIIGGAAIVVLGLGFMAARKAA